MKRYTIELTEEQVDALIDGLDWAIVGGCYEPEYTATRELLKQLQPDLDLALSDFTFRLPVGWDREHHTVTRYYAQHPPTGASTLIDVRQGVESFAAEWRPASGGTG